MIPRYTLPEMGKIWSESNSFDVWLKIEIAVCEAWRRLGLISAEDIAKIRQAKFDIKLYEKAFQETRHDIVSFVRAVNASLGDEGRWIHYGLTSNDIKDTALSIQTVGSCSIILADLRRLQKALAKRAIEFKDLPCVGRSHGIHAEPMSFGLKFALWFSDMERNIERLNATKERAAICKISGPVGTYATIPPEVEQFTAQKLNLKPASLATQVIQRDIHAEYILTLALIAASVEKIATELRHLQRSEVGEVYEPFNKKGYVSKGSSSMPHKRNPELSERVCGLARLIRGNAMVSLENVALWHERDISHSSAERITLPDSSKALNYILNLMIGIIDNLEVDERRVKANLDLAQGVIFSPRIMLELIAADLSRNEAYDLVQTTALQAQRDGGDFKELIKAHPTVKKLLPRSKLDELFDCGWYLRYAERQLKSVGILPDER